MKQPRGCRLSVLCRLCFCPVPAKASRYQRRGISLSLSPLHMLVKLRHHVNTYAFRFETLNALQSWPRAASVFRSSALPNIAWITSKLGWVHMHCCINGSTPPLLLSRLKKGKTESQPLQGECFGDQSFKRRTNTVFQQGRCNTAAIMQKLPCSMWWCAGLSPMPNDTFQWQS